MTAHYQTQIAVLSFILGGLAAAAGTSPGAGNRGARWANEQSHVLSVQLAHAHV